jgi:hypothetical protein
MALTKATYSMVSGAVINAFDYMTEAQRASVIAGDMVEDVTVPCQAALTAAKSQRQVFFPTGKYKTSAALIAYGGFFGTGQGTLFMPQGTHECFRFLPGQFNESWATSSILANYVGDLMIQFPGSSNTAGDPSHKGIWINRGVVLASDGSCDNVNFRNMYFRNCYNAIYQGFADKGNMWNCSFRDIIIISPKDYGIYLDLSGNNGSLNISFDNVAVDYNVAPSYGKGAYLNAIANLSFKGILTSRLTSDAAILLLANCTNVDFIMQQENNAMTVSGQRPTMILNCTSVEMALVVNTPLVNCGAGNIVNYIYVDDQTRAFILRQFQTLAETITSGSRKVINAQLGTGSSTKFTILDGTVTSSDVVMSAGQLAATYFPATNYALQNNPTTLRRQVTRLDTTAGVAATLIDVGAYGSRVGKPAGLYVIYGTKSTDPAIGFTDLILLTGILGSQTVVVVSTNNIGGADARTYSISGNNLQISVATNAYRVSLVGFDGAGTWDSI